MDQFKLKEAEKYTICWKVFVLVSVELVLGIDLTLHDTILVIEAASQNNLKKRKL